MNPAQSPRAAAALRRLAVPVALALGLLYALVVVRCAWLNDDAFITLRTVDNLVNGLGATWNPVERVQVYTHPLWMLLLAALYALWPSAWGVALALSIALSLAAAGLLALRVARSAAHAALALALLTLSRAYVDYSTSGLENPLTHLLLVLFALRLAAPGGGARRLLALSLLAGLGMLNRLDALLLFAPALALEAWRARELAVPRRLGTLALGFLPLVLWELFSLVYYGSLVPNTAHAKLGTGLAAGALAEQGLHYLLSSARFDPAGALVLGVGLARGLWRRSPLALGGLLYLAYAVMVGGDFMAGRFLTAPLLCAVLCLCSGPRALEVRGGAVLALAALGLSLALRASPLTSGADYGAGEQGNRVDARGVADERSFYFAATGLLRSDGTRGVRHAWADEGALIREHGVRLYLARYVGFLGFSAGPGVHVVDRLGLTDPLLARMPVAPGAWRVGHHERALPEGYLKSLALGGNRVEDPEAAALWACVEQATRGPLFTRERWAAIWGLHTGGCRAR